MTREEQITFEAGSIADGCIAHGAPWEDYYQGFIEGARWADANPFQPSISSNLDEAAEEYASKSWIHGGVWHESVKNSFKAGVEWMSSQIK